MNPVDATNRELRALGEAWATQRIDARRYRQARHALLERLVGREPVNAGTDGTAPRADADEFAIPPPQPLREGVPLMIIFAVIVLLLVWWWWPEPPPVNPPAVAVAALPQPSTTPVPATPAPDPSRVARQLAGLAAGQNWHTAGIRDFIHNWQALDAGQRLELRASEAFLALRQRAERHRTAAGLPATPGPSETPPDVDSALLDELLRQLE